MDFPKILLDPNLTLLIEFLFLYWLKVSQKGGYFKSRFIAKVNKFQVCSNQFFSRLRFTAKPRMLCNGDGGFPHLQMGVKVMGFTDHFGPNKM